MTEPAKDGPRTSSDLGSESPVEAEEAHRRRIRGLVIRVLLIYAASRVFVMVCIRLGTVMIPNPDPKSVYAHWDAAWYIEAIKSGYPHLIVEEGGLAVQSTIAFFPLFPLWGRLMHALTGMPIVDAAVLASVVAGGVAVSLFAILVDRLATQRAAIRASALLSFFPSSFAFLLPFSEGVMLTFAIGTMLALLDRRWLTAGVCAALATAARPNAVVLGASCAWAAAHAIRSDRDWRALLAPALAPLGILGYFVFLARHTGELTAWLTVQSEGWGYSRSDYGLTTVKNLNIFWNDPFGDLNALGSSVSLLCAAIGLWLMFRWRPPAILTIYTIGILMLAFMAGRDPASRPRYLLSAYPLIAAIAWSTRRESTYSITLGGSAMLLGVYSIICTSTTLAIA